MLPSGAAVDAAAAAGERFKCSMDGGEGSVGRSVARVVPVRNNARRSPGDRLMQLALGIPHCERVQRELGLPRARQSRIRPITFGDDSTARAK